MKNKRSTKNFPDLITRQFIINDLPFIFIRYYLLIILPDIFVCNSTRILQINMPGIFTDILDFCLFKAYSIRSFALPSKCVTLQLVKVCCIISRKPETLIVLLIVFFPE